MATSMASDKPSLVIGQEDAPDPFVTSPSANTNSLRFSSFDNEAFTLGPGASPTSAKHALEAHLADTERRMEEAGKLGTALVQQRKELSERLKEVEQLEAEDELSPELKQKLMSLEKDFNEVARESARAFLPKQRVPSHEATTGMPFTPSKDAVRVSQSLSSVEYALLIVLIQRSASPSKFEKFESMATGSPSKFSVPNRKMRNQPANRIHDIEFAAEISTSLITQVRNLQALLQERDVELKDAKAEKAGLEVEVQAFQQRMKNLDESESRYKDENWNLETQIQELIAGQKEAADREKKLAHSLSAFQADKNATQRELDEIKQAHSKLAEEHAAAVKYHDIELGTARRNAVMAEGERAALQRKIDELTSQNQELAKAMAVERGRQSQRNSPAGSSEDDLENAGGNMTPEHSPPPSPIKPTPRHGLLETETLKTSLQHAQRTIQSLRTNVHREKTEKLELKRLLQDARDEIEKLRSDPVERPHQRRAREAKSREFKKPAKLDKLGTARAIKAEILEDPEWEEVNTARGSPPMLARIGLGDLPILSTETDDFETANEAHESTDAFETAHERGTETEDFQTGVENLTDSDTETDSPSKRAGMLRAQALKKAPIFATSSRDYTYESTASTSNSEDEDYMDPMRTPKTPSSPLMRVRNRVSRSTMSRRSRQLSEEHAYQRSPGSQPNSSFSSVHNVPQQSLFAELGELEGSDEDSAMGTPGVRSLRSITPASTTRGAALAPRPAVSALPSVLRAMMVDSGTMTDPIETETASATVTSERPTSTNSVISAPRDRPASTSGYSDAGAQHDPDMEKLTQSRSPPAIGSMPTPFLPPPQSLTMSNVYSQELEPCSEPAPEPALPPRLGLSDVVSEHVEPTTEPEEEVPSALSLSQIVGEGVEPVIELETPPPPPPALSVSSLRTEQVEPVKELDVPPPTLALSTLSSSEVEPVAEPEPEPKIVTVVEYIEAPKPDLAFSTISSAEIEPVAEPEREPEIVRVVEYIEAPKPPPADLALSAIASTEVEPISEPEREPEILRVVEYVEAPQPPPPELALSAIASAELEPVAEPAQEPEIVRVVEYVEAPLPPPPALSISSFVSEATEPREEPKPLPPILSVSSIAMEGVEPVAEPETPQPALSVSPIATEHIEPKAEPVVFPPFLSVSTILSEQVEPVDPVEEKLVLRSLDFSSIQTLETPPVEPESPILGKGGPPQLQLSAIESLDTEPVSPRSPERSAIVIPRDEERPFTPSSKGFFGSFWSRGSKQAEPVVIAEDETRQSPNASPLTETPESRHPMKEISANTNAKPSRKAPVETSDSSAQTALTAEAIDQMFNAKNMNKPADDLVPELPASPGSTPGTVRIRRGSRESLHSVQRSKGKTIDTAVDPAIEVALQRPGSAASTRASVKDMPPLPPNHKEVIEAARTGTANSGQGTIGSMGPPLFPASAYKNPINRPRTSASAVSASNNSRLDAPRLERLSSQHGTADIQSPTRLLTARSRKSSVSSFASEVDHRFNIHNGMAMDAHGFGPNTDPRMIQAITQTMIGEYLWKYTRKTGRGELSENRHRRYFWVHPYTRTLYWSDRDPTSGGRSELRAKSVPIEAVRVVTDDNPMPPGLHRKSLIIISPGRSIKFTCTTGQRHETWFNALSYLLLRTNSEGQADTEEMMNGITREDVEEFNPQYIRRHTGGTLGTPRGGAPSISSYNSRGTRNEVASVNLDVPTLTPNHKKAVSTGSVARPSLAGRISGYWRSTQDSLSLRSRSGVRDQYSLYSNNDVHDSAEDLREEYERQDRESDRLDNVRSCCEGKLKRILHTCHQMCANHFIGRHDVGTLTKKRGSHGHLHSHPSRTSTPAPSLGTVRSGA